MVTNPTQLSRLARQIKDAVYALGEATVNQVVAALPNAPTVDRIIRILEEKK